MTPHANSFIASGENGCSSCVRPSRTFAVQFGIADQRAADGDQIELAARQARFELAEVADLRDIARVAQRVDEVDALQADRADGDRGQAGDLLGPAGEVEIGAFELRLPEAARRGVIDVDAGIGEGARNCSSSFGVSASLAV